MLRSAFIALVSTLALQNAVAQTKLTEIWRTKTPLNTPESVLYAEDENVLYVSCIEGIPDGKDDKGSIALVTKDGVVKNANWVTGISAPKGMAKVDNLLYVSNISEIVIIDVKKAAIVKRIPVAGAQFLNDVTADGNSFVYVSDSKTGKVHRLKIEGNSEVLDTYLEGLQGPNGLLANGGNLYVLASGKLLVYDKEKQSKVIAEGMDASTDGIVMTAPGEFVASCWSGAVYTIKDGKANLVLDTRPIKSNTADIGYNAKAKVIYVPTFFKNGVVAYSLK